MGNGVDDGLQLLVLLGQIGGDQPQLLLVRLSPGDVRSDRDVLERLARRVEPRVDRRVDPVAGAVLRAVPDLAVPHPALRRSWPRAAGRIPSGACPS